MVLDGMYHFPDSTVIDERDTCIYSFLTAGIINTGIIKDDKKAVRASFP
jgi:hypothetical protein